MAKKPVKVEIVKVDAPTMWKPPPEPKLLPGSPFKREPQRDAQGFLKPQRMDPPPVRNDCQISDALHGKSMFSGPGYGNDARPEQDTQRYRDAGNLPELPAEKRSKLPVHSLTGGQRHG